MKIPTDYPEDSRGSQLDKRSLVITSPFDIPGPRRVEGMDSFLDLIFEMRETHNVDEEEILAGRSETPPNIPECLVYLSIAPNGSCTEYIRKNLKPSGRWVCKSYMHHIKDDNLKGTYDYRNNIVYV